MDNFCFHEYIYKDIGNKEYDVSCKKCEKTWKTSEGWTQFCPGCNKKSKTTCSACGCGNCIECGYRFSCRPININDLPTINFGPLKFENIDRTNYRIES